MIGSFAITGIRIFSLYVPSSRRLVLLRKPPSPPAPLGASSAPKIDRTPPFTAGTFTTDDQLADSALPSGANKRPKTCLRSNI